MMHRRSIRRTLHVALVAALACLAAGVSARAQGTTPAASDSSRSWVVRVAGAAGQAACPCGSPSLPVPHQRQLFILAIGLRQALHVDASGGFEVAYDPQFLPIIVSEGTADDNLHVSLCKGNHYCATTTSSSPWTTNATGFGILPLGFTVLAPVAPRLRFQLRAAAGAIRLSDPVPLMEGHKFNFLAEASTSLELRVSPTVAFTAGMVLNHISNGGTSSFNPGMNSRMLEIGFVTR
jgi:hypothetical protein